MLRAIDLALDASLRRWAVTLMAVAGVLGDSHAAFASLFLGVVVAVLVTSFSIEPATARSAFERLYSDA